MSRRDIKLLYVGFRLRRISRRLTILAQALMEPISFVTEDGIAIASNYWDGEERAALLLHMMPATKESWSTFAALLNSRGWSVLAIDLRGHGKSNQGGALNFAVFTDRDHQKSILDVTAAHRWLQSKSKRLAAIAGASIGANLALWYQTEKGFVGATVLLSPGFNYRGIETRPFAAKLTAPQSLFAAGGTKDIRGEGASCAEVARELHRLAPVNNKEIFIANTDAHGTDLFAAEPKLPERIAEWLEK